MSPSSYKVLLIEDDTVDQMAFARLVKKERLDYDCTMADAVSKAKEILQKGLVREVTMSEIKNTFSNFKKN